MSEWQLDFLLKYNLCPLSFTKRLDVNTLDTGMEVGTEEAFRYRAISDHVITETKKKASELQLYDDQLELNHELSKFNLTTYEIAHHHIHPDYNIFVDLLVPTDPPIFVINKVNAMIK